MDDFRIDTHKLIYHPQRLSGWLRKEAVYPIYIEISPCSACNHRCIFCAFDYLGHKPLFFDEKVLKRFLRDIAQKGVKSILFSGEGETLLYRQLPEVAGYAARRGLDVAVTTNGVLLTRAVSGKLLPHLKWLRISLNAATPKTYALVHGTSRSDFDRVIRNLRQAVRIKRAEGLSCTIGVQFLLLNENHKEAHLLAPLLAAAGVDYLIIKPYSQHPLSENRLKTGLDYSSLLSLEKKVHRYATSSFKVIFRRHTMHKIRNARPYRKCLGLPFYAHLTAEGDLYACSSFIGDKRFCYGNVYKESFADIWNGPRRRAFNRMMAVKWDIAACREVCRLDEINRYLWELKYPGEHVNFI
ncbi:MAG: radical SAM protein [Candidatus Omnitrophica bacterium]|nr:radical SAM protein [Candidatus Omnitrophota bacterium]